MFISFEGIDGCGKSTQARALARHLGDQGRDVLLTREPGGSPGAEEIRSLLVEGDPDRWSPETEILLFNAARRDHIEKTILPALEAGKIVISDRFADSTRVYQGAVRPELREMVEAMHQLAIGLEPDRSFVIDIQPEDAARRLSERAGNEDRFEQKGMSFQVKLAEGFRALAATDPDRIRLIDGNGTAEEVLARVLQNLGL